ncbi:7-methylguanosine phosphate-specific 5'-nucleotidase [Zerene cesonia]|uniref:7-methylguanosine phosphate-specific 5'-nucleotidase n=1 Tax=Zerene cesonia TaxID=33412 RepID=UPI0018E521B3|nr:7-methylguanosine phosphate-specific 5'-nucleotidase [Zerene cesonia]
MKLLMSLNEIPELTRSNVHIKDKDGLLKKLNNMIRDGNKNLQIVTDFDHTLTRHQMDNGTIVLTSFGMFRECPSVPQYYRDEDNRLSNIYKPIEVDSVMGKEEKTKHMIDWYVAAHKLLIGLKFPKQELVETSKKMVECFRIGVKDLIMWSNVQQVPVLVFSAGLGECVVAALEAANFLLPNVKVISNFLALDKNDTIVGIKGEVIHTLNKNETAIKNTEYYEMVKERNNVMLLGDNIGDAGMAEGMEHCEVIIKVGFLGRNVDANLQNYMNKFDIVLVNDHTMDSVNAICKLIL